MIELTVAGPSGSFLGDCSVSQILPHATGEDNKRKLWVLSERLVGQEFV